MKDESHAAKRFPNLASWINLGAEMNAMIAREPLFAELNNRARIAIADSIMTVEMSVPLDSAPLPKLKGRWFNGIGRFGFNFNFGQFAFEPKSGEANGRSLPEEI